MPREFVLMPDFADAETVWMPAELVLILQLADVETDWIPAELVLMDNTFFAMLLALVLIEAKFVFSAISRFRIFYATDRFTITYC